MIRTFIAFELPKPIIEHITSIQKEIRSYGFSAKWVSAENIHLTLKFLGNVNPTDLETIADTLYQSCKHHPPLQLIAKGIGAFPDVKRPRVVWVGMSGDIPQLIELQKELETNLEKIGFPKEGKPFQAHLTIARIKDKIDSKKLVESIHQLADRRSEAFIVDQVTLFKSDLKPSGPIYTKLKTIKMGVLP